MPPGERTRWVEFLSYIVALVYPARSNEEQAELREVVDHSVQTDPHRQELTNMGQTIAEMYEEQGRLKGKLEGKLEQARTSLLRQLRKRFKRVPRKVEARIAATMNLQELQLWLDNFATAATLADVGIPPQ
jgi:hypothetical protein